MILKNKRLFAILSTVYCTRPQSLANVHGNSRDQARAVLDQTQTRRRIRSFLVAAPRHRAALLLRRRNPMCKTKKNVLTADSQLRSSRTAASASTTGATTGVTNTFYSSASSATSGSSLASLRDSLPEPPALYPFTEIRSATTNRLSHRLSSSSWRCTLRGRDAVVYHRPFRGRDPSALSARLAALCRSHHSSLVRLLGASLADGQIYLAYEYAPGATLTDCLRNPRNPSFSPLTSWLARVQIAADLAQGLEYIHTQSATVHNRVKASGIIITETYLRAKICYFGAADLAGELPAPGLKRSGSRRMRIEGRRGYIAPEVLAGGDISQRSDVYALGVVLLELISGEEPVRCWFDGDRGEYERSSVVASARAVIGPGEEEKEADERRGRVRRWVDRRLRDSFPVGAAEELIRVALRCVEAEPGWRPEMTWVAGQVSKLLLESQAWGERVRPPTDFSVSLAPR